MSTIKLYKFRPLANCVDVDRAIDILETGRFWCSRFWELNDPMEGVYSIWLYQHKRDRVRDVFEDKKRRAICSFSGEAAFENPLLWGYYANGFRGIAIEVEVSCRSVREVRYIPDSIEDNGEDDLVERLLTSKLDCWKHEREYRFITTAQGSGLHEIGRITGVYFGAPYKGTLNFDDVASMQELQDYRTRSERVRRIAEAKGIRCREVTCKHRRVKPFLASEV